MHDIKVQWDFIVLSWPGMSGCDLFLSPSVNCAQEMCALLC